MDQKTLPLSTNFGVIRHALPADGDGIVRMIAKLARHHGDRATVTVEALSEELFGMNGWVQILVAEMDAQLIGYAALCGFVQLQFNGRGMDMHHLFVDDEFRQRGVGKSLVEACMIKASELKCRYLTVGTHPENHEAQAFYNALGFERRDAFPPRYSFQLSE